MTTHYYFQNLDAEESWVQRCINLIETHAPRMMKCGGGSVCGSDHQINRRKPRKTTPDECARIVELARAGQMNQTQIAREVGVTQSAVWHILRREGITVKDGRKDLVPRHAWAARGI